jgi:hypothetical protein
MQRFETRVLSEIAVTDPAGMARILTLAFTDLVVLIKDKGAPAIVPVEAKEKGE